MTNELNIFTCSASNTYMVSWLQKEHVSTIPPPGRRILFHLDRSHDGVPPGRIQY